MFIYSYVCDNANACCGYWEGLERARGERDVKLFQLKMYDLMPCTWPWQHSRADPHDGGWGCR